MKTVIIKASIIILTLFAGASVYAQRSSLCDKETISGKKKNVKKEVEKYAKKYKNSSELSSEMKEELKIEYTNLQEEHNKIYTKIKKDIANGWSFIGDGRLCKTSYYYRLVELEKETNVFLSKKRIAENVEKSTKMDLIPIIITGLEKLSEYLEDKAKDKAEVFYKNYAWKTYEEL